MAAPHRFPFQLIDSPAAAAAPTRELELGLTANAALLRGEGPLSLFLLLEIAAQAALDLAGGAAAEGQAVLLAGVEEMTFAAGAELRPPAPGDRLVVRTREEGRFGRLIKLRVDIDRDGAPLAGGTLLLAG